MPRAKRRTEDQVKRNRPAPVIGDVARIAGVSQMTVSRVINQPEIVRPQTRDRVRQAIEELGYRPNAAARSLVTRRSQAVGVVCSDTSLYAVASTLDGIVHAAADAGYTVSVTSLRGLESVAHALQSLVHQSLDGLVLIVPETSAAASFVRAVSADMPVVAIDSTLPAINSVVVDEMQGAFLVTEHLLSLGHETVYHVRGPSRWGAADARVRGWRAAIDERGLSAPKPLQGDWSARSGYLAGQQLARDASVSAIFAANDSMALGVLRGLNDAGRRVPEDVSVVGFDDIPEAAYTTPPLTTVRPPFRNVGRHSIEKLIAMIEAAEAVPTATVLQPELVVRRSAAAALVRDRPLRTVTQRGQSQLAS
jgi:DNA-binding LacI/PurR family transcriptional regulator